MDSMNKKGSQVGIVMSFTIFIFSILFIFTIISPSVNIDDSKLYSMGVLEKNVLNNITEQVEIVLINDDVEVENCLSLDASSLGLAGKSFIGMDSSKEEASSHKSSNVIYIDKNAGTENMFEIYFSDYAFERSQTSSAETCDNAKVYSHIQREIVRDTLVLDLIERYENNYSKTKEEMSISDSDEFNVLFVYSNSTQIGNENADINANIFAKTIQVEYLDKNGNEKIGEVILKVW